jgi:hypothetical protein
VLCFQAELSEHSGLLLLASKIHKFEENKLFLRSQDFILLKINLEDQNQKRKHIGKPRENY